jgi:hypothetical protein
MKAPANRNCHCFARFTLHHDFVSADRQSIRYSHRSNGARRNRYAAKLDAVP